MDSISHLVLGACIGEAMLGKKIGKKAMLWGALVNNLPDIDMFFTPLFHPVDALFIHRGITHSFLFVIIFFPLLGWLFSRMYPLPSREGRDGASWYSFFFICLLAHPLLDSCTVYGTGVFEPFSDYRLQFTSLFIIEPLYTLPLLTAVIVLVIQKKESLKRKFWAKFGLGFSTIYLFFTICNKLFIGKLFSDSMLKQNIHFTDYITTPTPLNNILWNVVAKDTNGFRVGYYSHFDTTREVQFSFIPRNDSIAKNIIQTYPVQQLIRFSNGYYCFTMENEEIHYNDLRFSFAGEFTPDAQEFVFSYVLKKDDSEPYGVKISRNAWRMSRFSGISKLIARIKGI